MITRSTLVVGILALATAVAVVLVQPPHSSSVATVGKTGNIITPPTAVTTLSAGKNAPNFYGENVGSALFARPLPPREAPAPLPIDTTPDPRQIHIVDPPVDVFANYVYSGTITADGQKMALVENSLTKEGVYLHPGDALLGAIVAQVDDNAITLKVHGQLRRIPKSNAYNVIPLSAQASSSTESNSFNTSRVLASGDSPINVLTNNDWVKAVSQSLIDATFQADTQTTFITGDGVNSNFSGVMILDSEVNLTNP